MPESENAGSLNMIDGNDLLTHPANVSPLSAPPAALPTMLDALRLAQPPSSEAYFAAPTTMSPTSAPALNTAGIAARELLEELRAGQLATERAFLERARGLRAEPSVSAPPAAEPFVAEAFAAESFVAESFVEVAPTVITEPVAQLKVERAPLESQVEFVPAPPPGEQIGVEKNLIFSLGDVRYAVPMDHIVEIAELENHTPVPNVPDWILGITNLRGEILSLIDLNALHGEPCEEIPRGSSLLVAQTNAGDLTTCLVVDRVYGVVNVAPNQIQKLDQVANNSLATHTRGYFSQGDDLLSLLDLEGLLRAFELQS